MPGRPEDQIELLQARYDLERDKVIIRRRASAAALTVSVTIASARSDLITPWMDARLVSRCGKSLQQEHAALIREAFQADSAARTRRRIR